MTTLAVYAYQLHQLWDSTTTRQSYITFRPHCELPSHPSRPIQFSAKRQWRNNPLCYMTLLAIKWSLLQRAHYSALSVGKKTRSRR